MKKFILLFLLIISLNIFGQADNIKRIKIDSIEYFIHPDYFNRDYVMDLYNINYGLKNMMDGNWIQFYKQDTTKIARRFQISGGKLSGKYESFYFNGFKKEEGYILNAKFVGRLTEYYDNGTIKSIQNYEIKKFEDSYKYPKAVGTWLGYYRNGRIREINVYDTVKNRSYWVKYYENGFVEYIKNKLDGKIDGEYIHYANNGTLLFHHNYKNGKLLDSISIFYYPNGKIRKKGRISDDKPVGKWTFYYENGNKKSEGSYLAYSTELCSSAVPREFTFTAKSGTWIYYYPNGNTKAKGKYKLIENEVGRGTIMTITEIGEWIYYYENGNVLAKGKYELNPNNIKHYEKEYKTGTRLNNWNFYDEKGIKSKLNDSITNKLKKIIMEINTNPDDDKEHNQQ